MVKKQEKNFTNTKRKDNGLLIYLIKARVMTERLEFFGKEIIEFYPYRTARCMHSMFIKLSPSQKEDLRDYLGSKMDNHITWKTDDLCYTYSDGSLYIGTTIEVMRW